MDYDTEDNEIIDTTQAEKKWLTETQKFLLIENQNNSCILSISHHVEYWKSNYLIYNGQAI